MINEPPLVSIACLTFNHERYVRECLDGFVSQKTTFRFEIVIHDDASTDSTQEIIREYIDRFPNVEWRPILQTENQYKNGKGILQPIVLPKCRGKYIALCEGDDYWTDPLKLQKQVDFLEEHENYSMCFHAAEVLLQGVDASRKCIRCEDIENREYTSVELFSTWIVPTASMLFCREIVDSFRIRHPEWLTRGDIALVLKCSHVGKVMGMADKMSVYRMQPNSVTYNSNMKSKEMLRLPKHFICLYRNFPRVDRHSLSWCISQSYYSRMKMMRNPLRKICDCLLAFYWNPGFVWSKIKKL